MKTDLAIVGGGPAGLSAAIAASDLGVKPVLIDENPKPGGQLIKQTHMFFGSKEHYCGVRGIDIAEILSEEVEKGDVETFLNAAVIGIYEGNLLGIYQADRFLKLEAQQIIVATGASENHLAFPNNDLPGVYGAGAVQTLMNVHGVRPGRRVLMIGSGNIGLIVSYQLIQAGVDVAAVVEALPEIGGYLVHASKIRRLGVPIYTSHTIKEAIGEQGVERAVIWEVDETWQGIPGSEKELEVDIICLAVGLSPLTELLWQAGCAMVRVPELGGHVAVHDENMETSVKGIYVAGDASGIEEAVTAMLEGRIAGAEAACAINPQVRKRAEKIGEETRREIEEFRKGPFGEKARVGKEKIRSQLQIGDRTGRDAPPTSGSTNRRPGILPGRTGM